MKNGIQIQPLVDTTSLIGVESTFIEKIDPWSIKLSSEFADLIIYSDLIRIPLPIPSSNSKIDELIEPSLLYNIEKIDRNFIRRIEYSSAEPIYLKNKYLNECFGDFEVWARNNRITLKEWLELHKENWVRKIHLSHNEHNYLFSLEELKKKQKLNALSKEIDIKEEDLLYSFDAVLKYAKYGELAGKNQRYFNHPIREIFNLPTMKLHDGKLPEIAISFKDEIKKILPKLTQEDYLNTLFEIRDSIRNRGIHKLKKGQVEKETLRELAAEFNFRPKLKESSKISIIIAEMLSGLSVVPILGPIPALASVLISVSTAIWEGNLPRSASKIKWLRWSMKWDIENQMNKKRNRE